MHRAATRRRESTRVYLTGSGSVPVLQSGSLPSSQTPKVSSGSALVQAALKNRIGTGAMIALVLALLVAAGNGTYEFVRTQKHQPFEKFTIENVSNNGHMTQAAISPDGKYILQALEEKAISLAAPHSHGQQYHRRAARRYTLRGVDLFSRR